MLWIRPRPVGLTLLVVLALLPGLVRAQGAPLPRIDSAAILRAWTYVDLPVATGRAQRAYTYGPAALLTCQEPYVEAANGSRPVVYFDKGRLEEAAPNRVTAGLLARELIGGQLQLGDATFRPLAPATVPAAGDMVESNAPTYATLAKVASLDPRVNRAPDRTGQVVTDTLDRAGRVGSADDLVRYNVTYQAYRPELGHNIPNVFVAFFARWGTVAGIAPDSGAVEYWEDRLIFWTDLVGLPMAEAYWAVAPVGGIDKWVLIQPYERRVLTYTPENEPAFHVEMGNIGQHYRAWRYPHGGCG